VQNLNHFKSPRPPSNKPPNNTPHLSSKIKRALAIAVLEIKAKTIAKKTKTAILKISSKKRKIQPILNIFLGKL